MGLLKYWLGRSIKRGVEQGVDDFIKSGAIDRMIREILAKPEYAWFRFIKHMQARLAEADPALDGKKGLALARRVYLDFLKDEKVEFGDVRYDWSRDGARAVIEAYEIDHWEGRA